MEKSIIEKSKELMENHIAQDVTQLEMYLKMSALNKKLIENGLSKQRGYNLLTTEEICSQSLTVNYTQTF
jgi:hypothetical protein